MGHQHGIEGAIEHYEVHMGKPSSAMEAGV